MRSTNVGSGLATTFGTIPFENTPQGNLHETRLSSQNSRVNLLVTTKVGAAAVRSFLEIDFLGDGPANAFVTANSHTPRMRHAWAQSSRGKFDFTGGQTWTLLTPNRNGLSPVSRDVVTSQNLDANLQLGLVWARQTQFRFVVHPIEDVRRRRLDRESAALHRPGGRAAGVLPGASKWTPAPRPARRARIPTSSARSRSIRRPESCTSTSKRPCSSAGIRTYSPATDHTFSTTGTGVSVGAVIEPVKDVHLIGTTLVSDGGGRYMIGQAPDFMVNADAQHHDDRLDVSAGRRRGAGAADRRWCSATTARCRIDQRGRLRRRQADRLRHSRRDRREPRDRRNDRGRQPRVLPRAALRRDASHHAVFVCEADAVVRAGRHARHARTNLVYMTVRNRHLP